MIEEATPRKNAEFTRGRPFAKGNGGRPKGSRNRTTVVAQALLAGEETEILRKAIEVAKAGDVQMLKFFLDRLLPRERLIKIDIPRLDFANDAVEAMMVISEMLANGQITPSEAASIVCKKGEDNWSRYERRRYREIDAKIDEDKWCQLFDRRHSSTRSLGL